MHNVFNLLRSIPTPLTLFVLAGGYFIIVSRASSFFVEDICVITKPDLGSSISNPGSFVVVEPTAITSIVNVAPPVLVQVITPAIGYVSNSLANYMGTLQRAHNILYPNVFDIPIRQHFYFLRIFIKHSFYSCIEYSDYIAWMRVPASLLGMGPHMVFKPHLYIKYTRPLAVAQQFSKVKLLQHFTVNGKSEWPASVADTQTVFLFRNSWRADSQIKHAANQNMADSLIVLQPATRFREAETSKFFFECATTSSAAKIKTLKFLDLIDPLY